MFRTHTNINCCDKALAEPLEKHHQGNSQGRAGGGRIRDGGGDGGGDGGEGRRRRGRCRGWGGRGGGGREGVDSKYSRGFWSPAGGEMRALISHGDE